MIRFLIQTLILFFSLTLHAPSSRADTPVPGSAAPDFSVSSIQGRTVRLAELKGKIVVLEWFNRGCPFVQKHYRSGAIQKLQQSLGEQGVVWLTVNSTSRSHKDYLDAAGARKLAADWQIRSAEIIEDAEGRLGKLYGAKTTPHLFVIDQSGKIAYQGAIDDAPDTDSDPAAAKVNYVKQAVEALSSGKAVEVQQVKPYGCSVKYSD